MKFTKYKHNDELKQLSRTEKDSFRMTHMTFKAFKKNDSGRKKPSLQI